MKGLTIGAIVLCKVLISEPGIDGEVKLTEAPTEITSQPRIKEGETTYTIVEGEIQEIEKKEYYSPIKDSGKFEKRYQEDLIIKSKEIDYLVISSRACGLKKDLTEMPGVMISSGKDDKKKSIKQTKEEVIVIRGDQIPEGYEKVTDKIVEEKVKESYTQNINEQELKRQEDFLKNLENDQGRFNKKKDKKESSEGVAEKEAGIIPREEAISEVKEIEKFEESPQSITAEEAFKKIEQENIIRLEKERKEQMAIIEEEKKMSPKKIVAEKATEVVPVSEIKTTRPSNEKSILQDAFKIITNE